MAEQTVISARNGSSIAQYAEKGTVQKTKKNAERTAAVLLNIFLDRKKIAAIVARETSSISALALKTVAPNSVNQEESVKIIPRGFMKKKSTYGTSPADVSQPAVR